MKPDCGSRAFTLVEILVAIVIIAVLATLAVPAFEHAQEAARATVCSSNLRQIGIGLNDYLVEHGNVMPDLIALRASKADDQQAIDTVLLPYLKDPKVFLCPSDTIKRLGEKSGTSYWWNNALNHQPRSELKFLALTEEQSRVPVLGDKEGFHRFRDVAVNILYADGHVGKDLSFRSTK